MNLHIGVNLLVLTRRPPAGTGYYAISLFEALVEVDRPGTTVTGFAAQEAAGYFSARARERLHILPSGGRRDRVLNELLRLPRAARRAGVDVTVNPAFLGAPWGSPRRALVIHDLYFRSVPTLMPRRRRWLLRAAVPWLARASDPVFAVSAATRTELAAFYPPLGARARVLHNGNRTLRGDASPASPTSRPYLLMVGTLTANKSPEVVVAALAALRRMGRDLMLVHIGDDQGRLAPLAAAAGVEADVAVLGHQPDDVLLTHYAHCAALVLPSIREGFGLPLIEAQAQGAPVIASDCDALVEVGGDAALFFPVNDPDALVEAVLTVLDDPARRAVLVERGRANAAKFSWDRTAAELLAALA